MRALELPKDLFVVGDDEVVVGAAITEEAAGRGDVVDREDAQGQGVFGLAVALLDETRFSRTHRLPQVTGFAVAVEEEQLGLNLLENGHHDLQRRNAREQQADRVALVHDELEVVHVEADDRDAEGGIVDGCQDLLLTVGREATCVVLELQEDVDVLQLIQRREVLGHGLDREVTRTANCDELLAADHEVVGLGVLAGREAEGRGLPLLVAADVGVEVGLCGRAVVHDHDVALEQALSPCVELEHVAAVVAGMRTGARLSCSLVISDDAPPCRCQNRRSCCQVRAH